MVFVVWHRSPHLAVKKIGFDPYVVPGHTSDIAVIAKHVSDHTRVFKRAFVRVLASAMDLNKTIFRNIFDSKCGLY